MAEMPAGLAWSALLHTNMNQAGRISVKVTHGPRTTSRRRAPRVGFAIVLLCLPCRCTPPLVSGRPRQLLGSRLSDNATLWSPCLDMGAFALTHERQLQIPMSPRCGSRQASSIEFAVPPPPSLHITVDLV